jgi:hypothetical protein
MSTRNTSKVLRLLLLLLVAVMVEAGARVGHAQDLGLQLCEFRYTNDLQQCAPNDDVCQSAALGKYTLCLLNLGAGGGGGGGGGSEAFCVGAKWKFDQCWGEYQACGGFFVDGCWDTYYSCWQDSGIDQCQ